MLGGGAVGGSCQLDDETYIPPANAYELLRLSNELNLRTADPLVPKCSHPKEYIALLDIILVSILQSVPLLMHIDL